MRLIDADELKSKKEYSQERHEWIVPVAAIDWRRSISIESLRPKGRWISTDDAYPDLYQHVLICINLAGSKKLVCEACLTDYFDRSYWRTIDTEIDDADLDEVTHWMLLPEPPEEM